MAASMKTISVAREVHEEAKNLLDEARKIADRAEGLAADGGDPKEVERLEDLARDYAERSRKLVRIGQRMFAKD